MPQKWTGKSLGSPFFQGLLRFFVKYGGRSAAYFIAYFVAAFYALLPVVRKSAVHYIVRRFPKSAKAARLLHLYRLNLEFGKILIDRAALGITGSVDIISSQKDKDICAELAAKGKGLIIITAHCGCWQTAMSCFDFIDGDKYVVYRKSEKDVDKHVHELSGKKAPVNFIDPAGYAGGAVEIIAALAKKGI
ncbi:MAG: hypothetical protein FWC57_04760, partial [Endomicrobia bacterium]|nr:hypothetical protein [Endomicrobiia bacterium]